MSSSNCFELTMYQERRVLFRGGGDTLQIPLISVDAVPLTASDKVGFVVEAPAQVQGLRLLLGSEAVELRKTGGTRWETDADTWLWNEHGVVPMRLEYLPDDEEEVPTLWLQALAEVQGRVEVVADRKRMVQELAEIHLGLVQDVIGSLQGTSMGKYLQVALFDAGERLQRVGALLNRMEASLEGIARQPSSVLSSQVIRGRPRGGDRVNSSFLNAALRSRVLELEDGEISEVGPVCLTRLVTTHDLPEHRHIAEGLRRLKRRAETIARYCFRGAQVQGAGASRHRRGGKVPALEPRQVVLGEWAALGQHLGQRADALLRRYPFLASAARPRTRLALTPVFASRPAYRDAFRVLVALEELSGATVDGQSVLLACRNLSQLYEYWCFVKTVAVLRENLGAPVPDHAFELVDEVYCPDLRPGQSFTFQLGEGTVLRVTYEPAIAPWKVALQRKERYGASFTPEALRPDILLEVSGHGGSALLVMDAKSNDAFSHRRFREMSNYLLQVVELTTLRQPVTHVFLLHRDGRRSAEANLPGYFGRAVAPAGSRVLGAVPVVPSDPQGAAGALRQVLALFVRDTVMAVGPASLGDFRRSDGVVGDKTEQQ